MTEENDTIQVTEFEVVFTDGERRQIEGTRLVNRSRGGITIIDERKDPIVVDNGNRTLQYSVLTVPEQTLKYAYELDKDGDSSDSVEGETETVQSQSNSSEAEENSESETEDDGIWDEDEIKIDDDIKIS